MIDRHLIVQDLKRVAAELGTTEFSREQYNSNGQYSRKQVERTFGLWSLAKQAAFGKMEEAVKKFIYQRQKNTDCVSFESTRIHILNLDKEFAARGNPEFLKMIVMPDYHEEYKDDYAFNCFLEYLVWLRPDLWLNLGDFLNAGGLSHWGNDSLEPMRIVPEVLKARETLGLISGLLGPNATKIMLTGNHEDWVEQFLRSGNNPQLFHGLDQLGLQINLTTLLDLDKYGIQLIPLNHILRIGKANFIHGFFTGDAHAKAHLSKLKANIYYGHLHDMQRYQDMSLEGTVEAHSLGCLCNLTPKFLRGLPNRWTHGCGEFIIFPDGSYLFTPHRIVNGRMYHQGKLFKA